MYKAKQLFLLGRFHKPQGALLLYIPCLWGLLISNYHYNILGPDTFIILLGAFLMRAAGCAFNDYVDRDIDKFVERTKNRPFARGSVCLKDVIIFCVALSLVGLVVLLKFSLVSIIMGFISFSMLIVYPFTKRFFKWPQLFLGLTFNMGLWISAYMRHNNFDEMTINQLIGWFIIGILWTVYYDTLYAHQDIQDDIKIGVNSTAVYLQENTKLFLSGTLLVMGVISLFTKPLLIYNYNVWFLGWQFVGFVVLAMNLYLVDLKSIKSLANSFTLNVVVGFIFALSFSFYICDLFLRCLNV